MPTRWLFVLLLWSRVFSSIGQTYAPTSFHETSPPQPWSAAEARLNFALGYSVKNVAGVLVIEKSSERDSATLRIAEGTFIGHDYGEWGGQLLFQPTAKQLKPSLLKEGNIRFFFQAKDHVYFIEGLAHLSRSTGALYQLTGKAPAFTWVKLVDFTDAPQAFAQVGTDVYIAQSSGFTILRKLQQEVILENTFWSSLYPNSVAVFKNNEVYIGMRGGYARLNTKTKALQFFQYMP